MRRYKMLGVLIQVFLVFVVTAATPAVTPFVVTVMPESSTTWPAGHWDEGYESETNDPLAPFDGQSVMFKGYETGGATVMRGGAYLVCRYKIEFNEDVTLNCVAVTGAGDHTSGGSDAVLRLLDENMNEIAVEPLTGFNVPRTHVVCAGGAIGRTFFIDEFDYSTSYRYREQIEIDYCVGSSWSPEIISVPETPVPVDAPFLVEFVDPDPDDTHIGVFMWWDPVVPGSLCEQDAVIVEPDGSVPGICATVLPFEPGIYDIQVAVEDECGLSDIASFLGVVYDPSGGFVTGGGWIEQPLLPGDGQFSLPFFDGNGNYYEMVTIDPTEPWISWDDANDVADAMRDGYGHLVTITSEDEQDFLYEAFGSSLQNKWYGGFQDPSEPVADANWKWVTGEPWDYTNWAEGEPNDGPGVPGSEQFLMGWSGGTAWNDAGPSYEPGYVVEYEGSQLPIGKATFGFVAKYKKGANVPDGQTEFVFHSGGLNFHSTSYDWLVVTGSDYAKFKGSGTINGMGDYKFMLWAGDDAPDTFRIKIWEEDDAGVETVVYDNGFDQAIGGGSIVIHKK